MRRNASSARDSAIYQTRFFEPISPPKNTDGEKAAGRFGRRGSWGEDGVCVRVDNSLDFPYPHAVNLSM